MKFLLTGLFLAFVLSANAFDTNNFVKKYCTETKDELICTNFIFTAAEKNDIQKTKFTISNAPRIEFINANIGSFNENLVNKFPNAVELYLNDCIIYLNYTVSSISANNGKLQKLSIEQSSLYFNNNSAALSKLTALKTIEINNPNYLQYSNIDDVFFSKNANLETVDIRGYLVYSVSAKAFANLKKLTTLKIIGTSAEYFNDTLIKSNTLLKEVNFDSNSISNIPLNDFFPKTLEKISFRFNKIQVITNKTFAGLTKLKVLSLSRNKIGIVSNNAFVLPALETLQLDSNKIVEIERRTISSCVNLKEILVNGNPIAKFPSDFLDDLKNIENAVLF
ncbi:hypothetical protein ACFFRR_003275 [Megaselia abdita]